MKLLLRFVIGLILLVFLLQFLALEAGALVLLMTTVLASLTRNLRTLMIAVALPALLAGGLICVSPWHREFGMRVMAGALGVLAVAVLGPAFLGWFQAQLAASGARLFGGQP
jgi:hypothetical protein